MLSLLVLLQRGLPRNFAPKARDTAQGYIKRMSPHIGGPVVRTDRRSRDYYITTKICCLDRLPNLLSNGAPLARSAINKYSRDSTQSNRGEEIDGEARVTRIVARKDSFKILR